MRFTLNDSALPLPAFPCLVVAGGLVVGKTSANEPVASPKPDTVASQIARLETGLEWEHMTRDWGGWRTRGVESGFHFSAAYAAEVFANVSGGLKRGAEYEGLVELALDIDPSKFSGWEGAKVRLSGLYPHGASPSGQLVGDLSTVSNIDAYDSWVLFELWLEQMFWREQFSIRLGQLAADEEFSISEFGALFLNATFGWPSFNSLAAPTPAYALAAPGIRLRMNPCASFSLQAAVYDGNPDPGDSAGHPVNKHGVRPRLTSEEGAFSIGEAAWHVNSQEGSSSLRGTYKLGGWYHSGDFPNQYRDNTGLSLADPASTGIPRMEDGNWGIYFIGDQMLWRERGQDPAALGEQGLAAFARVGLNPADRTLLGLYVDGGLTYQGPLPGRDQDQAGIAVAYLGISKDTQRLARDSGEVEPDHEIAIEGTYLLQINSWWTIQPDIQYLHHPGGSDALSDALVVGLRSDFIF